MNLERSEDSIALYPTRRNIALEAYRIRFTEKTISNWSGGGRSARNLKRKTSLQDARNVENSAREELELGGR